MDKESYLLELSRYIVLNPVRAAMARAYLTGAYSMKEIGDYFNVQYVTVSRAVKNYETGKAVCTM